MFSRFWSAQPDTRQSASRRDEGSLCEKSDSATGLDRGDSQQCDFIAGLQQRVLWPYSNPSSSSTAVIAVCALRPLLKQAHRKRFQQDDCRPPAVPDVPARTDRADACAHRSQVLAGGRLCSEADSRAEAGNPPGLMCRHSCDRRLVHPRRVCHGRQFFPHLKTSMTRCRLCDRIGLDS